jgi:hypothetical protein
MRIAIVMEGALVQQVFADAPGCTYATVDRDTEGVEPDRLSSDPADRRECTIETGEAETDREYVAAVFAAAGMDAVRSRPKSDPMAILADIVAAHDGWRDCSDMREALGVWSDSLKKARRLLRERAPTPNLARREQPCVSPASDR